MGLFGTISAQATVTDLGVLDADIAGPENSEYIGVIAAFNKGTIATCAATGTVAGERNVGGIVGESEGDITDCYATCIVTGLSYSGGLVGQNDGTITTSYVNGQVSTSDDEWGIGALVGYNDRGIAVNCLWEKNNDTVTDMCQGLTTQQMMNKESYSLNGWAENPNWIIDNGNDYPRLVWEDTPGEPIPVPIIGRFSGSGTSENPYQIETVEQLRLIGTANVLWDKHFVLTTDLDCSGVQFERIGACPGTGFSGDFDGAYYHISNLTLGSDIPGQQYLGLFGYIDSDGCVSQLIMENVQVECGDNSESIATLAGENNGIILNCGATGSLNSGQTCWWTGGLVGDNDGTIDSCYSNMTINAGNKSIITGGLVGHNNGTVNNSYSLGYVHGGTATGQIGGLAGVTDGPIINCYTACDISRTSSADYPYDDMGGLVSQKFDGSTIVSCYFLGLDNGLGTKLTNEQMKMQESFVGWDFVDETTNGTDDIWWIDEGQDYPRLSWEL